MTKTFEITDSMMAEFQTKINKLARKAAKLGLPEVSYKIVGHDYHTKEIKGQNISYPFSIVEVTGNEPVVLDGWHFVASIEHFEAGNIVRSFEDGVVPEMYRTTDAICEHCHQNRMRNMTYIVRHDNGETKQVGSTCLADFTGCDDAEAIANYYAWFDALEEDIADDDEFGKEIFRHGKTFISLVDYLVYVNRVIKADGWVSAARSDEHHSATKDVAMNAMFPMFEKVILPTDKERAEIKVILETVKLNLAGKSNLSDYEWNISVIVAENMITYRQAGYAASIIPMAGRIQEWNIKSGFAAAKPSNFLGVVGEKINNIKVTVTRTLEVNGFRNSVNHMYAFETETGDQLTWFSSNNMGLHTGDTTTLLVATVKEHKVYNGKNQTVITRCKLAE